MSERTTANRAGGWEGVLGMAAEAATGGVVGGGGVSSARLQETEIFKKGMRQNKQSQWDWIK